ncbi:DNA-processing protein DprA [Leifsonia sp. NPDC058248]|uniref:DNA-processing protein DprA n=1 Tax=Leifsonia sp. NPDC058248 TaxID=3346402 RepID=UPI0036D88552
MSYLELTHAQLSALLAPIAPSAGMPRDLTPRVRAAGEARDEPAQLERRFATAVFSTLAEPGDTDAVRLISGLGPACALSAVVERWPTARVLDAIGEVDSDAATMLTGRLDDALERWLPRLSLRTARHALESAARFEATLVTPDDDLWPLGFSALGDGAPIALWVRGDVQNLRSLDRSIALVGARAATGYGEHVAMESAAGLSDRGITVVSGGAYGIDGAAHRAALASDQTTIAFLAGGVDRLYPAGHTELLTRIAERGLLVAELPCGSSPTKWRFLLRNRLIAAASSATVVVEAGRRSGSLNTAGHAAAIGRPLGAVPGPVTSPASAGCHRLLREFDAVCVTDAAEMAELANLSEPAQPVAGVGAGLVGVVDSAPNEKSEIEGTAIRLLDALSRRRARSPAELAASAGMSVREVTAALGGLELAGTVAERPDGWVRR